MARSRSGDRSYRDTAHCCYPYHLTGPADRRVTTVFLPSPPGPLAVVHEWGHAVHWELRQIDGRWHKAAATTEYAAVDDYEAFAEFFTTWRAYNYGDEDVFHSDERTRALLDQFV